MTHPLDEAVKRGDTPVELLNGLTTRGFGWVRRRAQKAHDDQFGATISHGDWYYARDLPIGCPMVIRLSAGSMEKMLEAVFSVNHLGSALGCSLSKENETAQEQAMQAAAAKMSARGK